MGLILIFFVLLYIRNLIQSYGRTVPLKGCQNDSINLSFVDQIDCFVCYNINISSIEEFKKNYSEISNNKCISFNGGNIGPVNSDFFKQFPEADTIFLNNVKMSLKSSKVIEENKNLESLYISNCEIRENLNSNALHSLTNLKTFNLIECLLEKPTIDKKLLEKNVNLTNISLQDGFSLHFYIKSANQLYSFLSNINEDAFENIPDLKHFTLKIEKMNSIPQKLFEGKNKLERIIIHSGLTEFPSNLPESVKNLKIEGSKFKKITNKNFENLKNLEQLLIVESDLEEIEKNSFENLGNLKRLSLDFNKLKKFSSECLRQNKKLVLIDLRSNPCVDEVDLSNLGFTKVLRGLHYRV